MDTSTSISFGEWLRRRRKALGLTQAQLAQQLNCSTILLRKIEAEERRPSVELSAQLATILMVPASERAKFQRYARGNLRAVINEPAEVYPWQANATAVHSNLPASTTSFIGREQELARLREYANDANIRLITMMGPPGIGKTRLSLQVARQLLADFPDGVFFVPLAGLVRSSQVAPAIFQALGYVESKNQFTIAQLVKSIGDKQMLIVLDNFEHLIQDSASLSSALLYACPRLKILATSRESLRVPGEWLFAVSALDFPKDPNRADEADIARFPALTLFAERARAVSAGFAISSENAQSIAAICARLEGVPLAIELIASRIRFVAPRALWQQMDEQFVLSADGMRAVALRQKTLRNAVQWSYDLLSAEERELLQRLAVFAGGWTPDAAEWIFADQATEKRTRQFVDSLADKSLIQRTPDDYDGVRWTMLMFIREFGLDELRKTDKEAALRDKHLAYFLELAERADDEIHGPDQIAWMNRIERNHDNLHAALDWCVTKQYAEFGLRLLGALGWTWWMRGHYSESRNWFEKIRALPGTVDCPASYAKVLNRLASQSWNLGQDRDAESLLDASQAIWRSLGEEGEKGLADCWIWMSYVAFDSDGDVARAASFIESSIALYQKHADSWGRAHGMLTAGYIAMGRDRSSAPLIWFEQSLELFQQLGDVWGASQVYQCMGRVYLSLGEFEKAHFCFEQQMNMDQSVGYVSGIVNGLCDLGHVHFLQGEPAQGEAYFEKSLAYCRQHGMEPDRAPLFYLCLTALYQNNYAVAAERLIALYHSAEDKSKKRDVLNLLSGLAAVAGGTNQPERAAKLYGAAQVIHEETGYLYPPFFGAVFARPIEMARERLGDAAFEMIATEGRWMKLEEAVGYALGGADSMPAF